MEKLILLFFKIAGIGFLALLLFNILNSIVLKSAIPEKFKDATWEGKWKSENFSLIGGKIIAQLPDKIPNNEEFEAEAMIYYNIWSIYKMGGIKEFKLIGMLGDDNSGGGENKTNENLELKPSPSFNFKAKVFGNENQKIDYSGIANREKTIIVGGYKSSNPGDLGSFKLKRKQ